jgi:phage-related holin
MIPDTILRRENQSMQLSLGFYIVEEKIKILKEGIGGHGFPSPE